MPLDEYGIGNRAYELAAAGAAIAREVADESSTPERRRFVAGSMGPGTKFASLGQVTYATLREAYEVEAAGLIDGGVDLLIIETQFDLLGVKAAMNGARRAMRHAGRDVPLQVQVTIELSGRMLPGTEIGAALTAIEALGETSSDSTARPGRRRCTSRSAICRPIPESRCPVSRTPACRGSSTERWRTT